VYINKKNTTTTLYFVLHCVTKYTSSSSIFYLYTHAFFCGMALQALLKHFSFLMPKKDCFFHNFFTYLSLFIPIFYLFFLVFATIFKYLFVYLLLWKYNLKRESGNKEQVA